MPLFRPSELRNFLTSLGRGANHSLSQNFLIDGNVLKKIVDFVPISGNVLEIGPGPGVLTEELLARQLKVTAIEKDAGFAHALHRLNLAESNQLIVIESDICAYELAKPLTVVGNIPYGISKEICLWMIKQRSFVPDAVLMVQKEFAEKLIATPGASGFGALSLMMQYVFTMKLEVIVSPSCFWPKPKATSAVVTFKKREGELSLPQEEMLFDFITRAYQHRRKKVATALGITGTSELFEAHVDTLDLQKWIEILRSL